jgi:DMSO/TMAO reductase YedYZ molybdopterin-dependent catalytic subunit
VAAYHYEPGEPGTNRALRRFRRRQATYGAIAGVLTAAVAIGVGQLISGLTVREGAPWAVVGEAAINLAPPPVKNFAIATFGSNDKNVLVAGILVVLAIFAAVIGVLAMRRLAYGFWGLAVFAAVGVSAAVSLPKANLGWAAPTVFGALGAAFALSGLTRRAIDAIGPAPIPLTYPPSLPQARPPTLPQTRPPSRPETPTAPGSPDTESPGTPPRSSAPPATPGSSSPAVPPDTDGTDDPWATGDSPGPPPEAWTYRPPAGPARRRFLVASSVAVGATAVTAFAGRELNARQSVTAARSSIRIPKATYPAPPLPAGSDLKIPNLSSFVTSNSSFYRVDTAIVLPQVDPNSWKLHIHGMVDREISITFGELLRRPLIEHYVTLTCVSDPVSGPYVGNAKWLGASLANLIRAARPQAGASQLLCTSVDGFTSGTPIEVVLDGRDALLAVAMNGTALPVEHGFPARMVIPGLYGYVSATKWVTDIKVTTYQAETAYWAQRGWSPQAPIKTESRIDVPLSGGTVKPGRTAVAGVAWAQHRGIDAVEVRVDRGPWRQATLATVPGIDTWRQWVWYWDATPGNHNIEARATDHTGHTQTVNEAPPEPNGASGYPLATVTVRS